MRAETLDALEARLDEPGQRGRRTAAAGALRRRHPYGRLDHGHAEGVADGRAGRAAGLPRGPLPPGGLRAAARGRLRDRGRCVRLLEERLRRVGRARPARCAIPAAPRRPPPRRRARRGRLARRRAGRDPRGRARHARATSPTGSPAPSPTTSSAGAPSPAASAPTSARTRAGRTASAPASPPPCSRAAGWSRPRWTRAVIDAAARGDPRASCGAFLERARGPAASCAARSDALDPLPPARLRDAGPRRRPLRHRGGVRARRRLLGALPRARRGRRPRRRSCASPARYFDPRAARAGGRSGPARG